MRTSEALKKLWIPGQSEPVDPATLALINATVDTVSRRQLRGESAANEAIESRFRVLPRISEELVTEFQTTATNQWKLAGFLVGNVLFGAATGEIAAKPGHEELAAGLSKVYDTDNLTRSRFLITDAVDQTLPELDTLQNPGKMSFEIPVFNHIAARVIHNRPLSEFNHMTSFKEGYDIGAHAYPEVLGKVILAYEKYTGEV